MPALSVTAPHTLCCRCTLNFVFACSFPVLPSTEDWAVWDLPRDYSPLHAMPHLTRLTLNIVEELESNMPALLSLTQAGCWAGRRRAWSAWLQAVVGA